MNVIQHGPRQRLVVAPGVLLCVYTSAPTVVDAQAIRAAIDTEPDLKDGYHLLVCVDGSGFVGAVQLDADARKAFGDIMRTAPLWSAGYVIAMSGFTGVAVRAIFTGFMLLGRARPERVFATVHDAIAWTASLPRADRATIEQAVALGAPGLWAGTAAPPPVSRPA
jgi:hypothetical protein